MLDCVQSARDAATDTHDGEPAAATRMSLVVVATSAHSVQLSFRLPPRRRKSYELIQWNSSRFECVVEARGPGSDMYGVQEEIVPDACWGQEIQHEVTDLSPRTEYNLRVSLRPPSKAQLNSEVVVVCTADAQELTKMRAQRSLCLNDVLSRMSTDVPSDDDEMLSMAERIWPDPARRPGLPGPRPTAEPLLILGTPPGEGDDSPCLRLTPIKCELWAALCCENALPISPASPPRLMATRSVPPSRRLRRRRTPFPGIPVDPESVGLSHVQERADEIAMILNGGKRRGYWI